MWLKQLLNELEYCAIQNMVADVLTKGEAWKAYQSNGIALTLTTRREGILKLECQMGCDNCYEPLVVQAMNSKVD